MAREIKINPQIAELKTDMVIDAFYLMKSAAVKTSAKGSQFLAVTLQDVTGEIEAKIWDYDPADGLHEHAGEIVKVRGTVEEYNSKLQLRIENRRLPRPGDVYDKSEIVPTAPISVTDALSDVKTMLDGIKDEDYRKIAEKAFSIMEEPIKSLPAARGVHHAFLAGLLMHTYDMMEDAMHYADRYNNRYGTFINRDLLLLGAFCHDMAKRMEFLTSELGLVTEYSTNGQLLGHLVMGADDILRIAMELGMDPYGEKVTLLRHMILAHHGQREYGACVLPQTVEAHILSYVDDMNARIEIYREALAPMEVGTHSDFVKPLGHSIYKHM